MTRAARGIAGLGLIAVGLLAAPLGVASCAGDADEAAVRSLERTGKVAFVCMGPPGDADAALRAQTDCSSERSLNPSDFGSDDTTPHLYALVTLETRGELAVVDLTAREENVLDQDPSTPGDNPIPVGAQPVDVVATPLGTAVFVASAETYRPGLYAIGSELLRPCEVDSSRCGTAAPTLSSFPACSLPSPPGAMVLVADPPNADGEVRRGCGEDYEAVDGGAPAFREIDREGRGRQKLFVTLPREGKVVVVDAQQLLSQPEGSFEACEIEAEIALSTVVPPAPAPPVIPAQDGCAVPEEAEPRPTDGFDRAIPSGVAAVTVEGGTPGSSGARLYVTDIGLPVIHVLDLADPCAPVEVDPLLPTSQEDPSRVVITDRAAVSRLTTTAKRYLYAVDVEDKSVMAFDVTDLAGSSSPLLAPNPEQNPFQPPDRVRFAASPVDITIVQRDVPEENASGVAPIGTLCDPDPGATVCTSDSADCDLGTLYRTSTDFETGAGPLTLRGVFAMVALASGQVAIIDVEDFDAPCRGPVDQNAFFGCDGEASGLVTTDERSCNVVVPHQPRSGFYLLTNDDVGRHLPGIQTFPVLSLEDGTVVTDGPALRPPAGSSGVPVAVGGDVFDLTEGPIVDDEGPRNTIVLKLENPRVHQADQEWALTYQGSLPGFDGRVGDMDLGDGTFGDSTANFCDKGLQSEEAVRERLAADLDGAELDAAAARLADRILITENLADQSAPQWDGAECTFADCRATFGDATVPTASRDLRVVEAWQDRLDVAPPDGATVEFMECCFPTLVDYEVRAGDEWVLIGGASGFLHNVIADPETGVCRPSCDPRLEERNARAPYIVGPTDAAPAEDAAIFENALFQFALMVPIDTDTGLPDLARDMSFRFITQSAFTSLRASFTSDDRRNVQVQSLEYIPMTDEIIATDGGLEGLLLLSGDLIGEVRQYF